MLQRNGPIAILALQGGFKVHAHIIERLGLETVLVRTPADLKYAAGLILPGGESSVMLHLLNRADLIKPLSALIQQGMPTLATCAGLILCAREARLSACGDQTQSTLGLLNVDVIRNGWGRQDQSFKALITPSGYAFNASSSYIGEALFIRAPRITRVGQDVNVIGSVREEPVWVKTGNLHALTGHPELVNNPRIHGLIFRV